MMVNIGAAVNVIHGIRTHHAQTTGCPTWDEPGIRAALTGCEGSPGSVLAAAALAAEDTNLRAPSVAAFRHHWSVNATSTPPRHSLDVDRREQRQSARVGGGPSNVSGDVVPGAGDHAFEVGGGFGDEFTQGGGVVMDGPARVVGAHGVSSSACARLTAGGM